MTAQPSLVAEGAPDRRQVRVSAARALHPPAEQEVLHLPGLRGDRRSEERGLDLLADAGRFARVECRHHGERQVHRADVVGDGDAGGQGAAVLLPGHRHQPAAGLRGDVERGVFGLGAFRAPARRVAVDQPLVQEPHIVVAEAEALHHAGAEVVHHHVHLRDQLADDLDAGIGLEVDGEAAFAAAMGEVVGADAVGAVHRQHTAEVAEARRLGLDHVGAHVGHDERGLRTLLEDGEVENAHARKRTRHGDCSCRTSPRMMRDRGDCWPTTYNLQPITYSRA